jgi:hypothetical protein
MLRLRSTVQRHITQESDTRAQCESVLSLPALTQKHLIVSIKIPPYTSGTSSNLALAIAPFVLAEGRAEPGRVMFTVSDGQNAQVCDLVVWSLSSMCMIRFAAPRRLPENQAHLHGHPLLMRMMFPPDAAVR